MTHDHTTIPQTTIPQFPNTISFEARSLSVSLESLLHPSTVEAKGNVIGG